MPSRRLLFIFIAVGAAFAAGALSAWAGYDRTISGLLFSTVLMALLWVTEAIPLGATSLLPIALFPLFGIADVKVVTPLYANHIIFLFIAGFLMAFAMEKWGLHKRIAFRIIGMIGQKPLSILLGFMLASFILSMWISNTATTIMLLAPALAIIAEFKQRKGGQQFGIALLLGICYASSIGGTVTPIGTAPNLLLLTYYNEGFPDLRELNFLNWMQFALPLGMAFFILVYLYLRRDIRHKVKAENSDRIQQQLNSLGKAGYEERLVLVLFSLLALLWISRSDLVIGDTTIRGWGSLPFFEGKGYVRDSTVGMAIALLLFFIPARRNKAEFILEWKEAAKLPWDILFIFGGGFALAHGFQTTGLAAILQEVLAPLEQLPLWALVLLICLFMTFLTEITSNTATTQLILPLLILFVQTTSIPPIFLLMPATLSASYAFMLPVATPPNAIVFASGQIPLKRMMQKGLWLNLLGAILLTIFSLIFGEILI